MGAGVLEPVDRTRAVANLRTERDNEDKTDLKRTLSKLYCKDGTPDGALTSANEIRLDIRQLDTGFLPLIGADMVCGLIVPEAFRVFFREDTECRTARDGNRRR